MSSARLSRILSIVLLLGVTVVIVGFNFTQPRVMILHSYNIDYSWVGGVNEGMHRVMSKWMNYGVTWHYMDTKKHTDKQWLARAGLVARDAIDKAQPDVLIAVDNDAQELAAQYYVGRPGMNIVFAGINGPIEPYGYDKAENATGILELRQLDGLRETIVILENTKKLYHPESAGEDKPIRLFYVMDASKPVLGDKDYIDHYDWKPLEYAGSFVAKDYPAWQQAVLGSAGKTDYLFVTNYRQLPRSAEDQRFVPASEVMAWTEQHSPVPVVGLQVFNVEDGGMLAVGVSPYEQGEVSAQMADEILRKDLRAGKIPVQPNRHFIVAMRKSAMDKRGLRLPAIYESFSRATNTYFE